MDAQAPRHGRTLILAIVVLFAGFGSVVRPAAIGSSADRSVPSDDERTLRSVLARYAAGDTGAVPELVWRSADWSRRTLDSALDRTKRALKKTQPGLAPQERTDLHARLLRADRLRMLWLCAVINLDASRQVSENDLIAAHLMESNRAIELLYGLQTDITTFGPVPWPVDVSRSPTDAAAEHSSPHAMLGRQDLTDLIRLWFGAIVARLQELVEVGMVPVLIARGLEWFPDHAELLLARGSAVETILALERVDDALADDIYPRDVRTHWSVRLSAADKDYSNAYQLDSSLTEALVRRGRVRLMSGDGVAAGSFFDRADTDGVPARTRYLARLFRARRAQQDGRMADARSDYLLALELQPDARAPMLGLARLFDAMGDAASVRAWTSRVLGSPAAATADPWQEYVKGQAWQLDARMARLHTGKAQ